MHYKRLGLYKPWDYERYQSFCKHFRGYTELEVAALFNVRGTEVAGWKRRGKINTVATAMFAFFESAWLQQRGIASQPILPFHLMKLEESAT